MKKISILGSTGSIGQNTLDVMTSLNGNFSLYGISCNNNTNLLLEQINKYKPNIAVITNLDKYNLFIKNHGNKLKILKYYLALMVLRKYVLTMMSI